jgi:hypothetical protein
LIGIGAVARKTRYAFFLPVKVLSRVFRGKFVAALKRAFGDGRLLFHWNSDEYDRISRHNYSATTTALAV